MKLIPSLGVAFQAFVVRLGFARSLELALLPERALVSAAGGAARFAEPALPAVTYASGPGDSIASLPRCVHRVRSVRFDAAVPPTIDELLRVAAVPPPPRPPRRVQIGRRWAYAADFGAPCGGRAPSPASYL
jgi:hypothetical protein